MLYLDIPLCLVLIMSAVSDYKTYKIKNAITFPFILYGLVFNMLANGAGGLAHSLKGILVPFFILVLLYVLKMLGAGDIKLFCAIGSMKGAYFAIYSMAFSFIAGGVIAVFIMLNNKNFKERFLYLFDYLKACFICFNVLPYKEFSDKKGAFRFAYPVLIGTILKLVIDIGGFKILFTSI